jgi:hypothetical protein
MLPRDEVSLRTRRELSAAGGWYGRVEPIEGIICCSKQCPLTRQ